MKLRNALCSIQHFCQPALLLLVHACLSIVLLTSCVSQLHRAVDLDNTKMIDDELAKGKSIEALDYRKKTPLLLAAELGKIEIVTHLVENYDVNINATTSVSEGEITPLRYAIYNGDYQMFLFLVEHGADIHQTNAQGWNPLMTAAAAGENHMVDTLLEKGANIHAQTISGATAVTAANDAGHADIVVRLTLFSQQQSSN